MATTINSVIAKISIGGNVQTLGNLTYDSATGYWQQSFTAPETSSFLNNSGHYYPLSIVATDAAGNSATATTTDYDTLELYVKENAAPTVTLSGVTEGTITNNSKPTINVTLTDTNSGVSTSGAYAKIDGGTAISFTLTKTSNTVATGAFTPSTALADGQHTITIYAKDNDGNEGSASVTFRVLATAPSLTIDSPANNLITNNGNIVVSGTTNSDTGNTVTIKLDGVSVGAVTLGSDGKFSKSISITTDGTHTITVTSTNAAGGSTTVTRTVILDTAIPVFTEVIITPDHTEIGSATTYTIKVKVE